jgi:hypothetical protein
MTHLPHSNSFPSPFENLYPKEFQIDQNGHIDNILIS